MNTVALNLLSSRHEEQRLRDSRDSLHAALKSFPAEQRQAEYDLAMARIAEEERRESLRRAFDELSTEDMAKLLQTG